jgi:hypothetical protein
LFVGSLDNLDVQLYYLAVIDEADQLWTETKTHSIKDRTEQLADVYQMGSKAVR